MRTEAVRTDTKVPWIDVLLSAIAAVSWALIGMATTAGLGLHLLDADTRGELGPMTAAVVAVGAGGSVTSSGDVSAFGLAGPEVPAAVEITPLGVSLVGALLLSWFFLRSLRAAGVVVSPAELLARAGSMVVLFVATLGLPVWAGHDVITIDAPSGGVEVPGLGDLGGLLPDRVGDLIDAKASVRFGVDTGPTLLGGACWAVGVLLIALLASRRTPLPARLAVVHRVVRPSVSAFVTVLLVAVAAGWAAAGWAALDDDHPRRIAGAALLGAPNGVWLGLPIGLFVPFDGDATGLMSRFLPDPLDDLLVDSDGPVTLPRLAELDGRVWLLGVAAALLMLLAGVLVGVRTPTAAGAGDLPGGGALRFAGVCALRLGVVTAVALPLLAALVEVSVGASPPVSTGVRLEGRLGVALLLGAAWGAGAGAAGGLLARGCGAAGRGVAPLALGDVRGETRRSLGVGASGAAGPYSSRTGTAGSCSSGTGAVGPYPPVPGAVGPYSSRTGSAGSYPSGTGAAGPYPPGTGSAGPYPPTPGSAGPYSPGTPYRGPNPATNPYLRFPEGMQAAPEDARPEAEGRVVWPEAGGEGAQTEAGRTVMWSEVDTGEEADGAGEGVPVISTGRPPWRSPLSRGRGGPGVALRVTGVGSGRRPRRRRGPRLRPGLRRHGHHGHPGGDEVRARVGRDGRAEGVGEPVSPDRPLGTRR
ncbi:streptophobe family protein [Streptomyces sp. NPDC096205]|uniref:streptophobe family protein n=1 Tax=Streptomyces sp. NPDC096205 TaxID=3366081 RepID=UPI003824622B